MAEIRLRAEGAGTEILAQRLQEVFSLRIPVEEVPPGTLPRYDMKSQRWKKKLTTSS